MGLRDELITGHDRMQAEAEARAQQERLEREQRATQLSRSMFTQAFPGVAIEKADARRVWLEDGIVLQRYDSANGGAYWKLVFCEECHMGILNYQVTGKQSLGGALKADPGPQHIHQWYCEDGCDGYHFTRECPTKKAAEMAAAVDPEPGTLGEHIRLQARPDYAISCSVCPPEDANALSHRNIDQLVQDAYTGGWTLLPDGRLACQLHYSCNCGAQLQNQCDACAQVFAPNKGDVRDHA